jgi:hypothetical protein
MDSNFRYRARKARDFHNIPEAAGTARVRYGWRHRPHQAWALGRADTSPYQRVRFARPESTVSPTTAPSPSATIALMSTIV